MGKAAKNERRKLTATFFNNIAVAFIAAGFAVPYFAGLASHETSVWRWVLFFAAFSVAFCMHMAGRSVLLGIED
jgi:hypothetical protein